MKRRQAIALVLWAASSGGGCSTLFVRPVPPAAAPAVPQQPDTE